MGLAGVERVTGEEPAHGIAPAGGLEEAEGGAAEGENAALDFNLSEAGILGGDGDVCGEDELDGEREAQALDGDDEGLGADGALDGPRVEAAGGG